MSHPGVILESSWSHPGVILSHPGFILWWWHSEFPGPESDLELDNNIFLTKQANIGKYW